MNDYEFNQVCTQYMLENNTDYLHAADYIAKKNTLSSLECSEMVLTSEAALDAAVQLYAARHKIDYVTGVRLLYGSGKVK